MHLRLSQNTDHRTKLLIFQLDDITSLWTDEGGEKATNLFMGSEKVLEKS